jgi:RHS repeat-associated protein
MTRTLRFVLLMLALTLGAGAASAQVATGAPPFGSFGGGPDVVNLANLNSHIAIPVLHKAGRGTNFTYDLSYDSSVWYPVTSGSTTSWQPVYNWGWRAQTEAATGYVTYSATYPAPCNPRTWSNWVYHDPWGVPHPLAAQAWYVGSKFCGYAWGATGGLANDGSGYFISLTSNYANPPFYKLYSRDGKLINAPANAGTGSGNFSDRNGNQLTVDGSGNFFDTLSSTTPILTASGAGTPTSPTVLSYTAPSGGSASYTMKYGTYTVQTNFGCSGVTDFGPTSEYLVSEIDLPDNSKYTFTYEGTPGHAGYVTGRLASVTLPTGGTITYTYTGGSSGHITCSDGSASGLQRATPDTGGSYWSYSRTPGSGAASTDTITDPVGNVTTVQFQGIYETQRVVNQGASTLLETVYTCYNGSASPCTGTAILMPIASQAVTTILPGSANLQSKVVSSYNSYGQLTEEDDYGYGSGAPGALLRKKVITIQTVGTTQAIQTAQIQDGSGNVKAQTTMTFDEGPGGGVTATSGTPQHTNPTVGRGNPTTISYLVQGSTALTKKLTYFDTGNVMAATDANGNPTTYTYSSTYGNAYPTTIKNALNQSTTLAYDPNMGLLTSITDPNNQPTGLTYDNMGRPLTTNFPDGGQTSATYNYSGSLYTGATVTTKINSSQNMVSTGNVDGLGRGVSQVLVSDPSGQTTVATTYDANGRVRTVSNPYRSTSDSTYGLETPAYDGLGRVTQVTHADGSVAHAYYGPDVSTHGGIATALCGNGAGYPVLGVDEAGNKRQTWTDSLGRTIETDEPDSSNTLSVSTCYAYDANNNLLSVVQNGSRQRSFVYDNLSRLTSATTPESGTTNYYYTTSSGGLCAGDSSAVCRRTDARSITTTYTYDALSRVKYKIYSDGTPSISYYYDQSAWPGLTSQNAIGRLTNGNVWNSNGWITNSNFSYDLMGRPIQVHHWTIAGGDSAAQYAYDLAGDLISLTYPSGRKVTSQYNGAMQPTQVRFDSFNGTSVGYNYLSGVSYAPTGAPTNLTFGSGVVETECYNNRLQPGNMQIASGAFTWLNRTYNFYSSGSGGCSPGSGGDNGNVMGIADNLQPNRTQTFGYDTLNRISTAQSAATSGADCWGQSFGYDAWANLLSATPTRSGCPMTQLNLSVNAQNRVTNTGFSYDATGDLFTDGINTYTYDAEGRISTVNGTGNTYTYDAEGNRVQKQAGGTTTDYFWSAGLVLAEYNATNNILTDYIYSGSRRLVSASGTNVTSISNGSFEQGLTNWGTWGSATVVTNAANAHSGSNYLQISAASGGFAGAQNQSVAVQTGQQLTFGGWVNLQSGGGAALGWWITVYDSSHTAITSIGTPNPTSSGWTYQLATYTVPTGVAYVVLYSQIYLPSASTTIWVDDGFLSTGTVYYHGDHLGSARALTDTGGNVMWSATYLPFGQEWNPQITVNHYKFTGYERDGESGNDYAVARYFSSQYGRFTSPDPLGGDVSDPQTLNRYSYVRNNPENLTDPTGMHVGEMGCTMDGLTCDPCFWNPWACWNPCLFDDCVGDGGGGGGGGGGHRPPPQAPPAPQGGYGAGIDPYGTWDESLPAGVQVFPSGFPGGASGCQYGSGYCGGGIYGFTNGSMTGWHNYANYLDWLLLLLGPNASLSPGLQLIKQEFRSRELCVATADALYNHRNDRISDASRAVGTMHRGPISGPIEPTERPVGPTLYDPGPNGDTTAFLVGNGANWYSHRSNVKACAASTPLVDLVP